MTKNSVPEWKSYKSNFASFVLYSGTFKRNGLAENLFSFTPKLVSAEPPLFPKKCLLSNDSANIESDCIPTKVSQTYPHLSNVFDPPLKDKALKTFRYSIFKIFQTFNSSLFQKLSHLVKQVEELIEPCRAGNLDLSDIEILKKGLR